MSKENLEQFIQQISDSEELQSTIGDEIDTNAFIALGAEHGCEFTAEDLAEHAELGWGVGHWTSGDARSGNTRLCGPRCHFNSYRLFESIP